MCNVLKGLLEVGHFLSPSIEDVGILPHLTAKACEQMCCPRPPAGDSLLWRKGRTCVDG